MITRNARVLNDFYLIHSNLHSWHTAMTEQDCWNLISLCYVTNKSTSAILALSDTHSFAQGGPCEPTTDKIATKSGHLHTSLTHTTRLTANHISIHDTIADTAQFWLAYPLVDAQDIFCGTDWFWLTLFLGHTQYNTLVTIDIQSLNEVV